MGFAEILTSLHFNQNKSAVLVELVGTFFLVLTASLATHEAPELAPLAVGFMLMALIFAFGYISGGHFNPAVTLAALLCHRGPDMPEFKWYTALTYAIAQLAGAAGAGCYMLIVVGFDFPVPTTPNEPAAVFQGFFAESVFTFVLASVVMHVALSVQRDNDFYGFAIGMAVMSAALCVGGISGGAFNPAVATGLIVVKCFVGLRCEPMIHLWMYWASELVGALVAVVLFNSVTVALDDVRAASTVKIAKDDEAVSAAAKEASEKAAVTASSANAAGAADADEREMAAVAATVAAPAATTAAAPVMRPMPTTAAPAAAKPAPTASASPAPNQETATPARPAPAASASASPAAASPSPAAHPPAATPSKKAAEDVSPLDVEDTN